MVNGFLICVLVGGTNIRELLVDNGINVYRSVTRWTNCKGKQRCGTCIVDVSHLTTHFIQLNYNVIPFPLNLFAPAAL